MRIVDSHLQRYFHAVVLFVYSVILCACTEYFSPAVKEPPNHASQTQDLELQEFITRLVTEAVENSTSAVHRGRLAMSYDANGFTDAAIQTYEQARMLDRADIRWPYLESLAHASQGRIETALALMELAIELDDSYLPSYLARGYWLIDIGEFAAACDAFTQATEVADGANGNVPLALGIAQCKLELGVLDEAKSSLDALPEEDLSPYAELVRFRVARATADFEDEAWNRANTSAPGQISWSDPIAGAVVEYTRGLSGESILAQKLIDGGRAEDALQLTIALQNRYPDVPHLIELRSAALTSLGRRNEAMTVLLDGLRLFPNEYLLLFNLGLLVESLDQPGEALSYYDQTIVLKNDFVPAYDAKVSLLLSQGKSGAARDALEVSMHHRTTTDVASLYLLGILWGGEGEWEKSLAYLSRANELEPDNIDVLTSLALSLGEAQRYGASRSAINRAKALDADNPKVERAIATLEANRVLQASQ